MDKKNLLKKSALWLVIIGGLNWLLAAFQFNVVEKLFSQWPFVVTTVYVLVGVSAIYLGWRIIKKK